MSHIIKCNCGNEMAVGHLDWSEIVCFGPDGCGTEVSNPHEESEVTNEST